MEIQWSDKTGAIHAEPIPDNVLPYVEAIGLEAASAFLMMFGGSEVYLPHKWVQDSGSNEIAGTIGAENAIALGKAIGSGSINVPVAKRFLARHLAGRGYSNNQIARELKVSTDTARNYLRPSWEKKTGQYGRTTGTRRPAKGVAR